MSAEGTERRVDPGTRARFDAAIEEASARAAQQVAQLHRRRLVTQAFLAALCVSALVVIIGGLIISADMNDFARRNAIYDCTLFTQAAATMGDFVQSDAALRDQQNKQGLGKELSAGFEKIFPRSTLLKLAAAQQAQVNRVVQKWYRDASILRSLAGTDCVKHLGG